MRKIYLLICMVTLAVAPLSAQDVVEKSGVDSVQVRQTKAERRTEILGKLKQYLRVSGFLQGEYDWVDDRTGSHSGGTSSFYLRRARLTLAGDLYKGKAGVLDYRLYFDLVRIPKNPILDLWIRYQPVKEFGIQFGQFKNPLTFEASISPSQYDFIDFSYAVSNLAKMGAADVAGLNVTARDIGFQLFGGFIHRDGYSILNYNIGVVNGSGINTKDNNKSKDIFARLTVKPLRDFAVTAYYQWGEANLSHLTTTEFAEYGWSGSAEYVTMHRWGGGFNYDSHHGFVRGEYIAGLTGELSSEGAYVEGGKRFYLPKRGGMLWAGVMVDYFCRNTFDYIHRDTANALIDMRYSACVGYTPFKYLRVQLAYSLEHRLHYTFDGGRSFGNGVKLMVTGAF